jgi:hypothetical protein
VTPMNAMTPTDLLGDWLLDRTVHDRLAGVVYRVVGTTTLTQQTPDLVVWQEAGTMTRADDPTSTVAVSRRLDIVREHIDAEHIDAEHIDADHIDVERTDDRPDWMVRFADGRPFHPWRPGTEVVHDCAPDVYRGTIHATATAPVDSWTVVWQASGPAKDYRMDSTLTRPGTPTTPVTMPSGTAPRPS